MQDNFIADSCPIAGLRIDKNYKKYTLSIKVGTYYTFSSTQLSNQIHYHDCYELVYVLTGRGTFVYEDHSQILTKGDVFISDPYCQHEIHIHSTESLTLLYVFIKIHQKSHPIGQTFEEKIIDCFVGHHHHILHNQYQIMAYLDYFKLYTNNPKYKNSVWFYKTLENMIFNCLDLLINSRSKHRAIKGKYETSLIERALDYIDQNLEKKLSADMIANAISTSRRNLYSLFKKNMNKTVHGYIYERKISLAEHYLSMNLSVTEAAGLVGIEDLTYFNKLFKKYKNMSPRAYIKEVITKTEGYGRRQVSEE